MPRTKVKIGVNDLVSQFPHIAQEAYGWNPEEYTYGSNEKMNWRCAEGHIYPAVISQRTGKKPTGCPYCSGGKALAGFNDLKTKFPDIAEEANGWDPTTYTPGSGVDVLWRCQIGHQYIARISHRTRKKNPTGCPYCSNKKVLVGFNDLKTKFPKIAEEADGWDPTSLVSGSKEKRNWICSLGHSYPARVSDRTIKNSTCPYCANKKALPGFNDLGTHYPELAEQWDSEKNGQIGPADVLPGSHSKAWWLCDGFGHSWPAEIKSRALLGRGCPYCSGNQVLQGFNDFQTKYPRLAAEWHSDLNGDLKPTDVTSGSKKRIIWQCTKYENHNWPTTINARLKGDGCPICANKKVLVGFNDLHTTHPELANQWHPDLNGDLKPTDVTSGSHKRIIWRCSNYPEHVWPAVVHGRLKTDCPFCAGVSVFPGFNDLQSRFPEVTKLWNKELNGETSPKEVTFGSKRKVWWWCENGHMHWHQQAVFKKTQKSPEGCSVCSGKRVWQGFNDLQSLFPDIAREWHPDKNGELTPSKITKSSGQKVWWSCSTCGHEWQTKVTNRTAQGQGCIECCEYGYSRKENGWFYLMRRTGEQQFGISNNLAQRLKAHAKANWELVDQVGPIDGKKVYETERILKRWLKDEIGTVPGTKENWFISDLEVQSLADLREKSGLDIEIF